MALALNDRVQQQGTANTTVSFTLTASVTGFQTFAVIGNGNTTYYAATDASGNWEVGIGTYSTTGPTLTRTTILASSNSGSAVTFSGTVNVFVTYPSEKSVNLDGSGNVSALGTISSGTWQGSTVGVAYGGTGVTASSGANSVVLRDSNQNILANSITQAVTKVTSAAGTTTLTPASPHFQILTGTTTQTFKLPDATTLSNGSSWVFDNDSTGNLTVTDNAGATIDVVAPGGYSTVFLESNATVGGEWGKFGMIPSEVNWGTNSLDLGGATTITNGVWNGTPIAYNYGGTGLTSFGGANYALYSTSASNLVAGTLPVAAGGTGAVTLTGYVYGNGTGAFTASTTIPTSALTGNYVSTFSGGSTGLTPNTATAGAVTLGGTLGIGYGGTGQTTASAAFNALSPITTTGDLIIGNGTNSATRLGIGTNGYVLTSNGTTATWQSVSSGSTITTTDFTATAGQTSFTVSYTPGLVEVYRNGSKLGNADYTASTGTTIVLATAANAGDLIEVVAFSALNLYANITYDLFSGTGSQTVFTMSQTPSNAASVLIAISGVEQDPTTYSVSGTTLTFTTAPASGTNNIACRYLGIATVGSVASFSAGSTGLTPSTGTTGAVTLGGTLNIASGGTNNSALAVTAGGVIYTDGSKLVNVGAGTSGQFLKSNGASAPTWGTPSLATAAVQTTGFTAVAGNIYPCNTTSAAFTVTLPASASTGDQIAFIDYAGTFSTNNLTLNPNSLKINGSTLNRVLQTANEGITFVYLDSTQGWKALADVYSSTPFVNAPYTATYLVVAGGGSGGRDGGAGGGAGGAVSGTLSMTTGTTYTVTVGAGATATSSNPQPNGSNSSLTGATTAVGGGGAGGWFNQPGQSGGSGGGAGAGTGTAGSGTPGQGFGGGAATGAPNYGSGGGGGAGSVGQSAVGAVGGSGGTGIASSITGTPSTYAGGGGAVGGGGQPAGTGGTFGGPAGSPGGGASATPNSTPGVAAPAAGLANTGGGGGGGGGGGAIGSSGGSGVVIISVPTANYTGTTTGSPTVTTSGSNTIMKFTASGSYTA